MESLQVYLDGLFKDVPLSATVRQAKADLLAAMEDHYHDALARGLSASEALGEVISSVGSIDEVLAALDVHPATSEDSEAPEALTTEDAQTYWQATLRYAAGLGLGVALCIASVALAVLFDGNADSDVLSAISFLLAVSGGVASIIFATTHRRRIARGLRQYAVTSSINRLATRRLEAYQRPRMIGLVAGITCCICSIIPAIIIADNLGAVLLLLMVAIGVFYMIYVQAINNGYKRLAEARPGQLFH